MWQEPFETFNDYFTALTKYNHPLHKKAVEIKNMRYNSDKKVLKKDGLKVVNTSTGLFVYWE